MASFPDALLSAVARSILDGMEESVLGDPALEFTPDRIVDVWKRWHVATPDAEDRRAELEALARSSFDQLDAAIEQVEIKYNTKPTDELGTLLGRFLHLLPSAIRRVCRRPSDPAGKTVPMSACPTSPEEFEAMLPTRMAGFEPGDRPWAVGQWELEELLEQGTYGEVWKARSLKDKPPVVLHFILHSRAKKFFQDPDNPLLSQVLRCGPMPGIAPLQKVFAELDPPCLQYAYVPAADLEGLLLDWRTQHLQPDPWQVADLIQQLAYLLGQLHQLNPPIVHRNLRPANLLVAPGEPWGFDCHLANLGLGPWSGRIAGPVNNPYASPEQLRGELPTPQDDIYALGILWFQILVGDFKRVRPGGASWRRALVQRGMTPALLEMLERCFDDEPSERPADGNALANQLSAMSWPSRSQALRLSSAGVPAALSSTPAAEPTKPLVNSIGMAFAQVPAGSFWMGSPREEHGRRPNESPRHRVALGRGCYLSTTPVTQVQFQSVMSYNPARFTSEKGGGPSHPVEQVSYGEAAAFCRRLSALPAEKSAGRMYRLPTEAEWEYACRAGGMTPFSSGYSLGPRQATFQHGIGEANPTTTNPVGSHPANAFGLYDMHGNVWEWCADWFAADAYRRGPTNDPKGPDAGSFRVVRGGSYRNQASSCRCAFRHSLAPALRLTDVGFRVVMERLR